MIDEGARPVEHVGCFLVLLPCPASLSCFLVLLPCPAGFQRTEACPVVLSP